MPAILNEHTQFTDSGGKPLVSGKVYFGVQNADPVVSPISIFSDRALTVALANPQTLDSLGRATNKVWIGARYSIRVDDSAAVQIYQELDNGEADDIGVTALENVAGANTITATAATTITAYVDLQQYAFRTASLNTASVTLNIDSVGAKDVVKNQDQAILPSEFEAAQNIIVIYNSSTDDFEWVNHNDKIVAFYEGSSVVAAATTEIWDKAGNTVHITGNTGITSLGTAPNVGAVRWVIFDGTPTLTNSANLNLPGGANFTAVAGDVARVYADTTTQLDVQIFKADGTSVKGVVQVVNVQDGAVATGTTTMPVDDTVPQNTEGDEYMALAITPKNTNNTLIIEAIVHITGTVAANQIFGVALFQDATAGALAVGHQAESSATTGVVQNIKFNHKMTAGTTSATTFKIRAGDTAAGTTTFNGSGGGRRFGGVLASSITITEIAA